jgi:Stress-induced bacterial acidophilic repeat motif
VTKDSDRGFALVNPIIHKFISSKGGKVRTKKGLAAMTPEKRKAIASMGGKAKNAHNNTRTDTGPEE